MLLKEKYPTLIAIICTLCFMSLTCDAASHCDVCETYADPSHWENVGFFVEWCVKTGDWQGMAANIASEYGLHELAAAISDLEGGVQ